MRIFISPIIPTELVSTHQECQAAATFCRHLIQGDVFDKVYALCPTNIRKDLSAFSDERIEFISVWRTHKRSLFKVLSALVEAWRTFTKIHAGDSVWFYNLGWNYLPLYLLLGFKKNVRRNVIVADFTPPRECSPLQRFTQWLIRKAHARITLAHSDRFKGNKSVCIPGIVPPRDFPEETSVKREFLMSGALVPNRAFPAILPWFAEHPNCRLVITGRVPEKNVLADFSSKYPNIQDLGFLPYEEYLKTLSAAGICLNTRDPRFPENHENFPSKMIEYLLYNKVVVSTMRYPQLDGIRYIYIPLEKEEFMAALEKIVKAPEKELLKYANQGEEIRKRFSSERWKKEMKILEC